jgi:RNA polymerase sigma factor (sigma-70 family)
MDYSQDPSLRAYIKSIQGYERISHAREKELSRIIRGDDPQAADTALEELITANLFLVVKQAIRYINGYHSSLTMTDLISVGNEGLIRAAECYNSDHESGAVFSTFAVPTIRRRMERAIREDAIIASPAHHYKYRQHIASLQAEYGEDLTDEIILQELQITPEMLERVRKGTKSNGVIYLEDLTDDSGAWEDIIEDEGMIGADSVASLQSLHAYLDHYIEQLKPKHQSILKDFYYDPSKPTLEVLSQRYDLSRERIRQIHMSSLRFIRRRILFEWRQEHGFDANDRRMKWLRYSESDLYNAIAEEIKAKEQEFQKKLIRDS